MVLLKLLEFFLVRSFDTCLFVNNLRVKGFSECESFVVSF